MPSIGPTRAQQLRIPALRAKLPMSALTPRLRAMRLQNQRIAAQNANPLYDPSAPLSGHALESAAQSLTDATYQPQIAGLQHQIGSTQAQGTQLLGNSRDYYLQLAHEEAANLTRETAIGQLLQQNQGAVGQSTQQAFGQMAAGEQAREAQDAAVRGGGLGGGGGDQVAAAITGGQARSLQTQAAAQNSSAEQSANWAALANANLQARQVRGGEIQGQIANNLANTQKGLQSKLTELQANRANDLAKNLLSLRQSSFNDAATLSGLGLKQSDLQLQAQKASSADATANRRISAGENIASANRDAAGQRQQAALSAADQRAAAKAQAQQGAAQQKHVQQVRAASGKAWAGVENTLGLMSSPKTVYLDSKGQPTSDPKTTVSHRPMTTEETVGLLRDRKTPEWVIRAALDIRHVGYITPDTLSLIRRSAPQVRIPAKYRQPQAGALANYPH